MSYNHTTFSTLGAEIGHMVLTIEQKDLINFILDESNNPLKNPVKGQINQSFTLADNLITIAEGLSAEQGDPLDGGNGYEIDYSPLINNLTTIKDTLKTNDDMNFLRHTNRVSGENLQNDGELLSFLGLQGVASSYNSVNEALKDEGEPVEDNYSQMFSSVLGVGQDIMNDLVTTLTVVTGDLDPDYNPNGEEGAITTVTNLATNTSTFNTEILEQIDFDNYQLSEALRTLKRFGLGVSIMGMDKDTYFGKNIVDSVASQDVKDKLSNIV